MAENHVPPFEELVQMMGYIFEDTTQYTLPAITSTLPSSYNQRALPIAHRLLESLREATELELAEHRRLNANERGIRINFLSPFKRKELSPLYRQLKGAIDRVSVEQERASFTATEDPDRVR